jgi:hypothetical protein
MDIVDAKADGWDNKCWMAGQYTCAATCALNCDTLRWMYGRALPVRYGMPITGPSLLRMLGKLPPSKAEGLLTRWQARQDGSPDEKHAPHLDAETIPRYLEVLAEEFNLPPSYKWLVVQKNTVGRQGYCTCTDHIYVAAPFIVLW